MKCDIDRRKEAARMRGLFLFRAAAHFGKRRPLAAFMKYQEPNPAQRRALAVVSFVIFPIHTVRCAADY
jgi:hypothetical protein